MDITPEYEYVPATANTEITTVDSLEEFYLLVPDHVKFVYFVYFMLHSSGNKRAELGVVANDEEKEDAKKLRLMSKNSAIVFCNSCKAVQLLSELLRVYHVSVPPWTHTQIDNVCLHSLLDQKRRDAAIGKFRNAVSRVLICTDVASRGLDIPQVDLVVNFDLPLDPYDYIHRVGRTARAGREGTAMSFVTMNAVPKLQAIEALTKKKCVELEGVDEKDVLVMMGRVGKTLRVAKQFLVENGFEEKLAKRKPRKRSAKEKSQ